MTGRPTGRRAAVPVAALGVGLVTSGCLAAPVTSDGRRVAELYAVFMLLAVIVAAIVLGLATFAILRYRQRRPDQPLPRQVHGDLRLELAWTGLPILAIVGLLALTVGVLNGFNDAVRATAAVELRVTAYRWGWRFEYPAHGITVEGIGAPGPEAWVPVGENVRVTLAGEDVVHAFYVPRFLFKKDVIPGRENVFAFTVEEPGRYGGQCAEFCGVYHARMPFTIVAVPRAEYDAWVAAAAAGEAPPLATPAPSLPAPSPTRPVPEASG